MTEFFPSTPPDLSKGFTIDKELAIPIYGPPESNDDIEAQEVIDAIRAGVRGRKMAGRGDLVPVEVERIDGRRQIYWKKPEEAERLKAEGKATDPDPERLEKHLERVEEVVEHAMKNTEGFSFRPIGEKVPKSGFMVAHEPEDNLGHVIDTSAMDSEEDVVDLMRDWVKDKLSFIEGGKDTYFGGWADKDKDGNLKSFFLDVAQRVDSRDEAERLGRERNQKAVWDVSGGKEIGSGGTGLPDRGKPMREPGWWAKVGD